MARVLVAVSLVVARLAAAGEPVPPQPPICRPSTRPARRCRPHRSPRRCPWQHHLEVGAGLSFVEMPASVDGDGKATPIRFKPGVGFHVDLSWQVCRFFRFTGYVLEHDHPDRVGEQPAGPGGDPRRIERARVLVRGALLADVADRQAGAPLDHRRGGWGRVEYGRYTVIPLVQATQPLPGGFSLRERAESLFEVPVGLGGAIQIIPRWLRLHLEVTGAFVHSQIGDALNHGQYIDSRGLMQDLPPMPKLDASFVESIGFSLHL